MMFDFQALHVSAVNYLNVNRAQMHDQYILVLWQKQQNVIDTF